MKALGPEADAVWALLSPEETARLKAEMRTATFDTDHHFIGDRFLKDMAETPKPRQRSSCLTNLGVDHVKDVLAFLKTESPQVTALILSILPEKTAAATLQALPKQSAVQALHRLLHMGDLHPTAVKAVETTFAARKETTAIQANGPDRLASIMNVIDSVNAPALMAGLDEIEPGSAERIRALMFTFDDLATLDPASLQTLLANTDRALLIIALQDAKSATADAFYRNMTSRAGDVLRSEIETSGPYRQNEIEEARREIAGTARKLARRGDLMSAFAPDRDIIE
ncbi:MAG: FliG C-terminal domain-containing protein [Pseudomonadota bacterium]